MSIHPMPPRREPMVPVDHDQPTYWTHLREHGLTASEAWDAVKRKFGSRSHRASWADQKLLAEEIMRLRAQVASLQDRLVTANEKLSTARDRLMEIELDLIEAKIMAAAPDGVGHPLYRRVGLDQSCPQWVAQAVRRAYRTKFHPDGHTARYKAEAERRFKEAEGVFAQIWASRGF